jgi:hypothetical protein
VLPGSLIQAARPPENPYRQERIIRVRYEGLGLIKPNRRRPITAQRLVGLGQTNQHVDLLRARSGPLVGRQSLCPAFDRLLEIAMLIRLAAVLHQLIGRRRLLRIDVSTKSHTETQGKTHENSACHDGSPYPREAREKSGTGAIRSSGF